MISLLLTIIIPTFNVENDIESCIFSIRSVLDEELENGIISVFVKDGGSTDNTLKILEKLKCQFSWLSFEVKSDRGIYDAMNQSVQHINSKWVYFLGVDDKITQNFKWAVDVFSRDSSYSKIHFFNVRMSSGIENYNKDFNLCKLLVKNICHQGIIYPTKLLVENPYNIKYKALADWALNIKLFDKFLFHDGLDIATYNNQSGFSKQYMDVEFIKDKPQIFMNNYGFIWGGAAYMIYFLGVVKHAIFK